MAGHELIWPADCRGLPVVRQQMGVGRRSESSLIWQSRTSLFYGRVHDADAGLEEVNICVVGAQGGVGSLGD